MTRSQLTKGELEFYGVSGATAEAERRLRRDAVPGDAKRIESGGKATAPVVTFDWGSGGQLNGRGSSRLARKVYVQALGWLGCLAVIGVIAFGISAIAIWGDVDDYAGLEKKEVRDVSARLLNRAGHTDWQLVSTTHSSIFGHKAWSAKYKRPDAASRCIFVWKDGRTHHRMSRLSKCT